MMEQSKPKYLSLPTLPFGWDAPPVTPEIRKELKALLSLYIERTDSFMPKVHLCNAASAGLHPRAKRWLSAIFKGLSMNTGYEQMDIRLPPWTTHSRELRILWLSAVIAGRKTFRVPTPEEQADGS